jgi:hypothetical protein
MKALSIKQPLAYLIAAGIKPIENRTWPTKFRGRIFIQASGGKYKVDATDLLSHEQLELLDENQKNIMIQERFERYAIIGEVDIIDCVINHESIWAEKTEVIGKTIDDEILYNGKPIYNWVLANAKLYDKPILNVKGKLSFWEFEK